MDANVTGDRGGNFSLTAAGLATGTGGGTFKTVNTLTYTIDGVFFSKGATDNIAFSSGMLPPGVNSSGNPNLGNSQEAYYAVWIDSAGNFTTTMGNRVGTGGLSATQGTTAVLPPDVQAAKALVGLIKVSTDSTHTFTPGTTTLGSNNTAAYQDCRAMPTKPALT